MRVPNTTTFTLSIVGLTIACAVARPSVPIKGCTKTVVVTAGGDWSCISFAATNKIKLAELYKWNVGLDSSGKCLNLDDGNHICVSITPNPQAGSSSNRSESAAPTATPRTSASAAPTTKIATAASSTSEGTLAISTASSSDDGSSWTTTNSVITVPTSGTYDYSASTSSPPSVTADAGTSTTAADWSSPPNSIAKPSAGSSQPAPVSIDGSANTGSARSDEPASSTTSSSSDTGPTTPANAASGTFPAVVFANASSAAADIASAKRIKDGIYLSCTIVTIVLISFF